MEKKIEKYYEKATDDADDIYISLDIVRQHQQSGYTLPIGYLKSGISAWEKLIFNDLENAAFDLEEEIQDVLDWER